MKNKIAITFFLIFIFIISILLRIWNLDKPDGMWFDEYCTYNVINTDFFWKVSELNVTFGPGTCQPPLYFWILWVWKEIFGNADWTLRFLSVLFGSIAVLVAYFCGKYFEIIAKTESIPSKTGIIFSALFAISSIAIYYSQEMRVYSLVILLSTLLLLSILKLIIQVNNKNLFFLVLINFILLYTHTLAYAFCFFEFLGLLVYFYRKNTDEFKKVILASLILLILQIPGIYSILNNSIDVNISWTKFNINTVISFINAYISPIFFNLNNPVKIFSIIIPFLIFCMPLITIYFISLLKTLEKVIISRYLFIACVLFISALAFLNIIGKMSFIPRYGIEILPFMLVMVSYGLTLFKGKFINTKNLIRVIVLINLIFMFVFYENNAQNLSKQIFHTNFKDLSKTLNNYKFKPGDIFVIFYYGSTCRFTSAQKYYDFSLYENYIFDNCAWESKNFNECLSSRKNKLGKILKKIDQEKSTDKNVIITIPSNIFDFYEETIIRVNLEKSYKQYIKLDENGWVTLIYSNK